MALNKIKDTLTQLGLSETESRVYLAMIELGPDSVQNIAKKASISRTAAYDVIGALQDKGIASTFQKGKKTLFSAEDPGKLKAYFEGRVHTMKNQLDELKSMVPQLRVMQAEDRPVVRFYTGNEGIRAAFRDVEDVRATELLELTNTNIVYDQIDIKLIRELRSRPFFNKLPLKSLLAGAVLRSPKPNTTFRALPQRVGDFSGNIWIYKNRVSFVDIVGEHEVIIIESQVFADSMRAMFNAAWATSEPVRTAK